MTKSWKGSPPERCDVCATPVSTEFFDGRLRSGHWAYTCQACWRAYGVGRLGTGMGQHYVLSYQSAKWEKQE